MKVLAYHSIGKEGSGEVGSELYCVSEVNFREQVEYVANKTVIARPEGPKQSKKEIASLATLARNDVIFTFDDGLLNNYTTAYPILKEYGLVGYFFILVGKVGKIGYMNWQQVKELKAAGMTIGSHGMTHRILTTLGERDLSYELNTSKRMLEDELGRKVDSISIPRGFHNRKIISRAKGFGYKTIFTSENRIAVKADWDIEKFVNVLNSGYSLGDKAVELAKNASKKVLGAKAYDNLRTSMLKRV